MEELCDSFFRGAGRAAEDPVALGNDGGWGFSGVGAIEEEGDEGIGIESGEPFEDGFINGEGTFFLGGSGHELDIFVGVEGFKIDIVEEGRGPFSARFESGAVDPAFSADPTADVGRIKEGLAHGAEGEEGVAGKGIDGEAEGLEGSEKEMIRAFDGIGAKGGVVKDPAGTDDPGEPVDPVAAVFPKTAEDFEVGCGEGVLGEVSPTKLCGEEALGRRLPENEVDDLIAGEASGLAEKGLASGIVNAGPEAEDCGGGGVSGKGPGGFFDVGLRVLAFAEGEELEKLAGEVLVGLSLPVLVEVEEPDDRGGAAGGLAELRVRQVEAPS